MQAQSAAGTLRAAAADALDSLVTLLPRFLGFVLVLAVGWLLSHLVGRGVTAVLHAARFEDLARRSGLTALAERLGIEAEGTRVVTVLAEWAVRLIALVVAFDLLDLPAISVILQRLLLWLPNLAVALVVLVLGGLAANALAAMVRRSALGAGIGSPDLLATVTQVAVWVFAVIIAVGQLGIARTVVNAVVIGLVGAVALASGLAFGLGGRDRAARLLDRWAEPSRRVAPGPEPLSDQMPLPLGGRVPRSGYDRRRMAREGPDRRQAEGAARG
jgi:mechanosensitive ion channel-like protein